MLNIQNQIFDRVNSSIAADFSPQIIDDNENLFGAHFLVPELLNLTHFIHPLFSISKSQKNKSSNF